MPESILISSALHHWSIHWMGINSDSQQTSLHSYSNLFFTSFPSMVTIPCRSFLSAFFFSVPSGNPNALLIQGFHNLRLFPWLFNFSLDFDYLSFYHINLNKHSVIDPHFHTHTHTHPMPTSPEMEEGEMELIVDRIYIKIPIAWFSGCF